MSTPVKPVIVHSGGGKEFRAFGNVLSVLLGGEQTGGTLAVMLAEVPPGSGPPLHVHSREDELLLVIEGRISYFTEGGWIEMQPGSAVFMPRGSAHCYRNVGTTPSRQWILTTPSGFETFFAGCADEFAKSGGPDMSRIAEIHRNHGIDLLGKPLVLNSGPRAEGGNEEK
jgi:quercetin dioxygenase-like cupin family protein